MRFFDHIFRYPVIRMYAARTFAIVSSGAALVLGAAFVQVVGTFLDAVITTGKIVRFMEFRSSFKSWDDLFSEAATFATTLGPERLIWISHSEDSGKGVVASGIGMIPRMIRGRPDSDRARVFHYPLLTRHAPYLFSDIGADQSTSCDFANGHGFGYRAARYRSTIRRGLLNMLGTHASLYRVLLRARLRR